MKDKIIIFSDFDGTITNQDVLDRIITDVYSFEKYKEVESKLIKNELLYEDYLFEMFNNIKYDLSNISNNLIDSYFFKFYNWIKNNNIDFYIISSGFKKIIEHLLPYVNCNLIYGNNIIVNDNQLWNVILYDQKNKCSIDKNIIIQELLKKNYKSIFIGDGLSDFKVMGKVDYLFCKKDSLLHKKCIDENCKHIVYENFLEILQYIESNFI